MWKIETKKESKYLFHHTFMQSFIRMRRNVILSYFVQHTYCIIHYSYLISWILEFFSLLYIYTLLSWYTHIIEAASAVLSKMAALPMFNNVDPARYHCFAHFCSYAIFLDCAYCSVSIIGVLVCKVCKGGWVTSKCMQNN